MQRTAHASSAVRAYKCVGEKLRGVTSNVINGSGDIKDESKEGNEVEVEKQGKPVKEEKLLPGISIIGASNCTINIDYV